MIQLVRQKLREFVPSAFSDWRLKLYHKLPVPLRSVAANMRGYQLRAWRYGYETDRLVEEALEREHWTADQWDCWRQERLATVLRRAIHEVPYYRQFWKRRGSDTDAWRSLENWPILEKEPLRENPLSFLTERSKNRRMFHEHTSGTTGKSLSLWWSLDTVRQWYALFEARCRRWYGVSRHDRWAILGGQLITPVSQRKPPFWVWNAGLNQLYLSSYHLAPDLIPDYLQAIKHYRITYLLGYTSSLFALAQEMLSTSGHNLNIRVVVTNAEPLHEYQRRIIAEAFQCPVRETYGMAEIVAAASECNDGGMHLWPEVGSIEIMNGNRAAAPGVIGDLICTGLFNADMPLIRYRVGDRASLPAEQIRCLCGRNLPLLAVIDGRSDDVLHTVDGRPIGRLDPVFKADLPVREAQIIQESLQHITVRYVPTANFGQAARDSISQRLKQRLGDMEIAFEAVSEVPRTRNGKFRAVICKLSPTEKNVVAPATSNVQISETPEA